MRTHLLRSPVLAACVTTLVLAACSSDDPSSPNGPDASGNPPSTAVAAGPGQDSGVELPENSVDHAVGRLDSLARELMDESGIPGMSVAVVHGGQTVYAKGFGVREAGGDETVEADTVFQLASMSKPLGATVVAHQVEQNVIDWDTPVARHLPGFTLSDPYVGSHVTVGDLYSHRSGLPDHAGDDLEDLGFGRDEILRRLRLLPLDPYRISYAYTNFGVTAAAEAVAAASGVEWAELSEQVLYEPLGMASTSSRFEDFAARDNRAPGHVLVDGRYVARDVRNPDAQSPAGGVSSSADDVAHWLAMLLADGRHRDRTLLSPDGLRAVVTPQSLSSPPVTADSRPGFYGYGFNVGTSAAGRVTWGHSGAFSMGVATAFTVIPSADVAIVVLTNAAPSGIPETLTAEFSDLVQFGEIRQDWRELYRDAFAQMSEPTGSLVGQPPADDPRPPKPLAEYAATYDNDYYGPARVDERDGTLVLTIGPAGQTYELTHRDGDVFTFPLSNENAPDGTISTATFTPREVTLEFWDAEGLGTFRRGDR